VIVPIFRTDEEKAGVMKAAHEIRAELIAAGIRVKLDERDGLTPGFKFNDWEMRGVPLRIEIGPKDVANGTVALSRRDKPGKEGKSFAPQEGVATLISKTLDSIQESLYKRALAFREANTGAPQNYYQFKEVVEKGFAISYWCGRRECEAQIKEETKATTRCVPLEQESQEGSCIRCGLPAKEKVIFAKAY
jgi:prolyl-tRNA synthetase